MKFILTILLLISWHNTWGQESFGTVTRMEDSNYRSYLISSMIPNSLIFSSTGKAPYTDYAYLASNIIKVPVSVFSKSLNTADYFLVCGSKIQYHTFYIRDGKLEAIQVVSPELNLMMWKCYSPTNQTDKLVNKGTQSI